MPAVSSASASAAPGYGSGRGDGSGRKRRASAVVKRFCKGEGSAKRRGRRYGKTIIADVRYVGSATGSLVIRRWPEEQSELVGVIGYSDSNFCQTQYEQTKHGKRCYNNHKCGHSSLDSFIQTVIRLRT